MFKRKPKYLNLKWDKKTDKPIVETTYRDVWSVEATLTAVIISLLETLRDNHVGTPLHFKNDDEYIAELNRAIEMFKSLRDEDGWADDYEEKLQEAYGWLKDNLPMLWD